MAAITAGESEVIEQPRNALIEHGLSRQALWRGEPALADAGWAADRQVGMVVDPAVLDKLGEQRAVESARGAVVDILDAGLLAQLRVAQAGGEPLVMAQRGFTFEQQREPFGLTEAIGLAGCFDVGEGLGHPVEAEGVKAVEGRMGEQGMVS